MQIGDADEAAMQRAVLLASTVVGRTSPNPAVGAVILDAAGLLAGEGATQPPGGPHAEVVALAAAGGRARGGTAVVTLEPCVHTGRTGPCTEALITAGVVRVVYAVSDPTPEAGGGARAGALRPWLFAMTSGRPFVTWKSASTLDGRVAAADRSARWISSSASRADAHNLRARVDAVVVGSGTALADDPQLTVRGSDDRLAAHQPLRVVLDRRHRVPPDSRIFDAAAPTLTLDTAVPRFALKALYDRGVRHVLLEGGPTLAGAFVEARCVDEVVTYLAPMLLGAGACALGDAGIDTISEAVTLDITSVDRLGGDIKIVARPIWPEGE